MELALHGHYLLGFKSVSQIDQFKNYLHFIYCVQPPSLPNEKPYRITHAKKCKNESTIQIDT